MPALSFFNSPVLAVGSWYHRLIVTLMRLITCLRRMLAEVGSKEHAWLQPTNVRLAGTHIRMIRRTCRLVRFTSTPQLVKDISV